MLVIHNKPQHQTKLVLWLVEEVLGEGEGGKEGRGEGRGLSMRLLDGIIPLVEEGKMEVTNLYPLVSFVFSPSSSSSPSSSLSLSLRRKVTSLLFSLTQKSLDFEQWMCHYSLLSATHLFSTSPPPSPSSPSDVQRLMEGEWEGGEEGGWGRALSFLPGLLVRLAVKEEGKGAKKEERKGACLFSLQEVLFNFFGVVWNYFEEAEEKGWAELKVREGGEGGGVRVPMGWGGRGEFFSFVGGFGGESGELFDL